MYWLLSFVCNLQILKGSPLCRGAGCFGFVATCVPSVPSLNLAPRTAVKPHLPDPDFLELSLGLYPQAGQPTQGLSHPALCF